MRAARLETWRQLADSVAEEMGGVLRRTAYSPNIKERRDYSCAVFDREARMAAQAAHIPVHLGSMPLSVRSCVDRLTLGPGDAALLNDPFRGGTHLPDLTVVAPVHDDRHGLLGYVASRAHHADVGGMAPGSMPLARELVQEGLVIPPVRLVRAGELDRDLLRILLANVRTPDEREGDLRAQLAAARVGSERLRELARRAALDGDPGGDTDGDSDGAGAGDAPGAGGSGGLDRMFGELYAYSERSMRRLLARVPDGAYSFRDVMEDDGAGGGPAEIVVEIAVSGEEARVDFTGTARQREAGINAVRAITLSAVFYVFRALVEVEVPSNAGCLAPVEVVTEPGSLVDARPPVAVAGGNVETSQRIVDVLLGALASALPERVPAASQGTMNNLAVGGTVGGGRRFAYYETLAGGGGGRPDRPGADAVHSHMTNTRNTPVEALEFAYPLRVRRYELRRGSGGEGRWPGGQGVRRELELLRPARVTLLTERRRRGPWGLSGGSPGAPGRNLLLREGEVRELPAKTELEGRAGDRVRLESPGGGGWGEPGGGPGETTDRGGEEGSAVRPPVARKEGAARGRCEGEAR